MTLAYLTTQEGTGFNKAVELYNPTTSTIDLSGFRLDLYNNGAATVTDTVSLTGNLAPNAVYIICRSTASTDAAITSVCDQVSTVFQFTGDDVIEIRQVSDSSLVDTFGEAGASLPAGSTTGWPICGENNAANDNTVVRKPLVDRGNTNWGSSAGTNTVDCEWLVLPRNTFSALNDHDSFFAGLYTLNVSASWHTPRGY